MTRWTSVFRWAALTVVLASLARADDSFRDSVAPIFERRCYSCHNARDHKGEFSLESATEFFDAGFVESGDAGASYLLELIAPADGPAQMPKDADPLPADEIAAIRKWIDDGARWPEGFSLSAPKVDSTDWWSLQPVVRPPVPDTDGARLDSPIDAFVADRLRAERLEFSPPAETRDLIRRVYFDIVGLPPTFEDIEAYAADPEPDAYERLVDRLLASPAHGERWARHWLDVVHFGETHGYDKDKPRPNAWPYRDYIIRAFNQDRPFGRFIEEQLAGDAIYPGTRDGIEGLGFIAAGPWDLIGHTEVPESKIDGKIARHLDRDDMVANTMQTFCSLTVHCAQCHHHKFDPITQEDYYSLQAVFAAIDRADKRYDLDPVIARTRDELERKQHERKQQADACSAAIAELGGSELKEIDRQIADRNKDSNPAEHGYHSQIEPRPDVAKWVQVNLKEASRIGRLVLVGCHDDYAGIGDGFGFPIRFRVETASDPAFTQDVVCVADFTSEDYPSPGVAPVSFELNGQSVAAIRVTATKLAERQGDYIFALAELSAFDDAGRNVADGATVTALDSIEAPSRWSKANLTDGQFPTRITPVQLQTLKHQRMELIDRLGGAELRQELDRINRESSQLSASLAKLPDQVVVFAGTVHHGSGNFTGTGPTGGQPRPIHVLDRGDVTKPLAEVVPGSIAAIDQLPAQFESRAGHDESLRRADLARWIASPINPLTWRSMVNRLWQYHFGRGIVDTPGDFGRMGQLPTHPELLDWLAGELLDQDQSLKSLHRLMVTSSTYRQSSAFRPGPAESDQENRLLWRAHRRKLDAEPIRDAILLAADRLDRMMGGPSFQDFVIEHPEHSPHYQYHLHNADDPASHRRSVYRFLVRSQQQPFMTVLDCADPSMLVEKRNESMSPLQALALLNNDIAIVMAKHFADRLERTTNSPDEQVRQAYRIALARDPTENERSELVEYVRQFGLANACRVILNLNEFVFVD